MTTTIQGVLGNVERWARGAWYGYSFTFGHLFLALAVWNTFAAAISVTVWPRVYDMQMLAYMKPVNVIFPIVTCFALALFSRSLGLRPILKAVAAMGIIAIVTFAFWNYQSEAWLNQYGYRIL